MLLTAFGILSCITAGVPSGGYAVNVVDVGTACEYRLFRDEHHFGTIIDQGGTYIFRPHPGSDVNGWGSSWYLQPFVPDANGRAELRHTTIQSLTPQPNGIDVSADGDVSQGSSDTYGTWETSLRFAYDPAGRVEAIGTYSITLDGALSDTEGDLNLYRIASNFLDDVPLLGGGTGDTGDMGDAVVDGDPPFVDIVWVPPDDPSHFPTDRSDRLSIDVSGHHNIVDTAALGYEPIAQAFKPSMEVELTSLQPGGAMSFGGMYDTSESQNPFADNVGITPLVCRLCTTETGFSFLVGFVSEAPVCGNQAVESPEQCDDGNTTPGDGCDAACQVEPCFECAGEPSTCTCGGSCMACMSSGTCSAAGGTCECVLP